MLLVQINRKVLCTRVWPLLDTFQTLLDTFQTLLDTFWPLLDTFWPLLDTFWPFKIPSGLYQIPSGLTRYLLAFTRYLLALQDTFQTLPNTFWPLLDTYLIVEVRIRQKGPTLEFRDDPASKIDVDPTNHSPFFSADKKIPTFAYQCAYERASVTRCLNYFIVCGH